MDQNQQRKAVVKEIVRTEVTALEKTYAPLPPVPQIMQKNTQVLPPIEAIENRIQKEEVVSSWSAQKPKGLKEPLDLIFEEKPKKPRVDFKKKNLDQLKDF